MIKTRSALLYIFVTFAVIMLFASFEAERYFDYASKLDLSDKMMYRAMTENFDGIFSADTGDGSSVTQTEKTEFVLDDTDTKIAQYTYKLYYLDYITEYPQTPEKFDEILYDAVFRFQEAKGLTQNGELDKQTTDAITVEPVEYKAGKQGSDILQFQLILAQLGYLPEDTEMNGTFGEQTENAVRLYQQANGLIVTGTVNAETQLSLKRDISEQTPYESGTNGQ